VIGALLVLCIVACAVAMYRRRIVRADREAEREWLAEEESWWAELRNTAP
jgi:hypothetical protein